MRVRLAVLAGSLLLAWSVVDAAAAPAWTRVTSRNFVVVGDVGAGDVRGVAFLLEQFREVITRLLPKANVATTQPMFVVVFRSNKAYEPFKPRRDGKAMPIGGQFMTDGEGACISLCLQWENSYTTIFHEYAHHLVQRGAPPLPTWLNEGVAEFYSTFQVTADNRSAKIGIPDMPNVHLLRERFMPLADVLTTTYESPLFTDADKMRLFYAESWALVHDLLTERRDDLGGQVTAFINKVTSGTSDKAAFEEAFGLRVQDAERELRNYVRRYALGYRQFRFNERVTVEDRAGAAQRMSEAEVRASLARLLFYLRRDEEAAKRLGEALQLDPRLADAHAALGELHLREGRFPQAVAELEQAATLDPSNALTHYEYARALAGPADDARGARADRLAKARAEAKRATELEPTFAGGVALLGVLTLGAGYEDEGEAALRRAFELQPGRIDVALNLAQLYARRGRFSEARALAEPIAARGTLADREKARICLTRLAEAENRARLAQGARSAPDGTRAAEQTGTKAARSQEAVEANWGGPSYREPQAGETRQTGFLEAIDCDAGGLVLRLRVTGRVLRFTAAQFEDVAFISYREDLKGKASCGPRNPADPVILTSRPPAKSARPAAGKGARTDGVAVAVEFIRTPAAPK